MKECAICKRVFGDHVDRCDRDHSPLKITLPISPLINSYRLDERIGSGSLGIVYKGAKIGQNFPLAIKVISPEIAQAEKNTASVFLKEASDTMQVNHPNIVQVSDFGQTPSGALYLVMEYLDGFPLTTLIAEEPDIPIDTACNIILQLSNAIATMHKQGKLHCDLKPSNIFILYDQEGKEQVKILDFGLSKVKTQNLCNVLSSARTQNFFNLPFYLSPEQCDGEEASTLSEVYTLGAIFYHLLTGRPPFIANSHRELMHKHINAPLPFPRLIRVDIPEAIESILLSCLSKEPEKRLSSVSAIANLIKMAIKSRQAAISQESTEVHLLPATTAVAPELEQVYNSTEIPLLDPEIYSIDLSTGMPKAPETNLQIPSKINPISFTRPTTAALTTTNENSKLTLLTKVLVEALKISKFLSGADVNPYKLISQLNQNLQNNSISKEGELFAPNLIKIFVPRTNVRNFQEIEAIFNSGAFINNVYKYIRESGYRLFSTIKLEIEIVHPQAAGYEGCSLTLDWPLASDVSNGLERIIQVDAQKIVKMQMPVIQVPTIALLQPINAATYANYHLIINPITYIGRFRNVLDVESSNLIRRNDVSFLQPNHPSSPNTTVSRQHGKIEFIKDNFYLYDTGSTNGTKINRRENNSRVQIPIEPDADGVLLKHRDIIQLGTALLSFEIIPSENVSDFIDKLVLELEIQQMQPGSNSEAYKTMVATTSLSGSVIW
ncbi:MAG: protein kinase [Acidobacteria bacterium]|nr:protein kinase [Acidobacteriota bacterium]